MRSLRAESSPLVNLTVSHPGVIFVIFKNRVSQSRLSGDKENNHSEACLLFFFISPFCLSSKYTELMLKESQISNQLSPHFEDDCWSPLVISGSAHLDNPLTYLLHMSVTGVLHSHWQTLQSLVLKLRKVFFRAHPHQSKLIFSTDE